jgi:hypothetical protein
VSGFIDRLYTQPGIALYWHTQTTISTSPCLVTEILHLPCSRRCCPANISQLKSCQMPTLNYSAISSQPPLQSSTHLPTLSQLGPRLAAISHQPPSLLFTGCLSTEVHSAQVKVKVTLRLTVNQSVSLGVEPHLRLMTRYLLLFDSYGLVFVGRPLWRGNASVFCIWCWPLPVQSFSGPSPLRLATIFYCLRFETSLSVASYDSQGHGGDIRPRLHTGEELAWGPCYIASGGSNRKHRLEQSRYCCYGRLPNNNLDIVDVFTSRYQATALQVTILFVILDTWVASVFICFVYKYTVALLLQTPHCIFIKWISLYLIKY